MAPQALEEKLGDAVLQSVQHGAFPQDEDVISAPVSSTALPKLLAIVDKAREEAKASQEPDQVNMS